MSLAVRLFLIGAAIALVAVVAAAWATVHATSVAVHEQQQESLHADAQTYRALLDYASTHTSWSGAEALVDDLAAQHEADVTLTDLAGEVLVSSTGADEPLPRSQARARVDALDIDATLLGVVEGVVTGGQTITGPGAAPTLTVRSLELFYRHFGSIRPELNACLADAALPPVSTVRDLTETSPWRERQEEVGTCRQSALRTALAPYAAPPALLFVTGEGIRAEVFWDLSGRSQRRIALLAGGVLAVTLLLCAGLAVTIVRPLRRLSTAATRAGAGDLAARVPEGRRDEIGRLARAFNDMADRRQRLEEARRQLVSDVSHELRTPLANVRGWVEAAQDGVVAPDRELLATLHEESLHLQRLVEDLHDLALGDAGELRLELAPVDLEALLEQVADAFGARASEADVGLTIDCAPGAVANADPVRLRQAVSNLVANAVRHTAPGGQVTLRGRPGEVSVIDDGEGIPTADLPYVFDRFRRVDRSRTRSTGGSGLGLAIVRQIAEAHRGSAVVVSEPGRGTTVTLRLSAPAATPTA